MRKTVLIFFAAVSMTRAADSKICAECHREIAARYSQTTMANASARADGRNTPALQSFDEPTSGIHIQISFTGGAAALDLSRGAARTRRRLDIAIGSGSIGRSYGYLIDGFLYQSPVSYYARTKSWELSPGFERDAHLNLNRPLEPACLNCHASGLDTVANTINGYRENIFKEAGVSCERCHGPGEKHIAAIRSGRKEAARAEIVNPARLSAAERDSVCAQCHLVSASRIANPGITYQVGKRLFDAVAVFVPREKGRELAANSHFEQLVASACWRGSGSKLWCGTCHDAHGTTDAGMAGERSCLGCHGTTAPACAAKNETDCAQCHMPKRDIPTVQHASATNHTIPRIPARSFPGRMATSDLVPFPGVVASDRAMGLALADRALSANDRALGARAIELLNRALDATRDDAAVELELAQLLDRAGRPERACVLYEAAVKHGAQGTAALIDLGACQAAAGNLNAAMQSWRQALSHNPAVEAARLNLVQALAQSGDVNAAHAEIETALRFDPFSEKIKGALK